MRDSGALRVERWKGRKSVEDGTPFTMGMNGGDLVAGTVVPNDRIGFPLFLRLNRNTVCVCVCVCVYIYMIKFLWKTIKNSLVLTASFFRKYHA